MVRQFNRRSACYGIAPIALLDRTRENERQFALVGLLVWLLAAGLKAQAFNSQHNSSVRRILKRNILFHEVHTSPQTEAHHSMVDPTSVVHTKQSVSVSPRKAAPAMIQHHFSSFFHLSERDVSNNWTKNWNVLGGMKRYSY